MSGRTDGQHLNAFSKSIGNFPFDTEIFKFDKKEDLTIHINEKNAFIMRLIMR